jgi:flagellar basal-body rod protein FlgF
MDGLTISVAGGLRARMESLELLANNIANQATAGYKSDREFYNLYLSPAVESRPGATGLPVIDGRWTDFRPGPLSATGKPTDLAIAGEGFFVVKGPGGRLYTRNGNLRTDQAGALVTTEGWPLLDTSGQPVRVDPSAPFTISPEGSVLQNGAPVGELALVRFDHPEVLEKRAGVFFAAGEAAGARPAREAVVRQGALEGANFHPAEAAVRLVSVMRQFEMLQKALHVGADMNRRASEEVARVES